MRFRGICAPKGRSTGLAVLLVAILGFAIPASASAATRYVSVSGVDAPGCTNPGTPCRHIAYAVTQASTGDTVDVGPGTFDEAQIVINRPMRVQGAGIGQTIVSGQSATVPGQGGLFFLNVPSVGDITIDGFTLTGGIKNNDPNPEPFLINAYAMPAGGTLTVSDNRLVEDSSVDPLLGSDYSVGLYANISGADVRALDNTFTGMFQALFLEADTGRATIAGNDFNGLLGSDCESPPLPACNGTGFQFPIGVFMLQYGSDNTQPKSIEGNTFRNFNGSPIVLNAGNFAPATLSNLDIVANHMDVGGATDSSGRNPSGARIVAGTGGVISGVHILGNDMTMAPGPVSPTIFVREVGSPAGNVSGVQAHFNRFRGAAANAVQNDAATTVDARENWWGCNGGPGAGGCQNKGGSGTVTVSPWLVLTTTATPSTVAENQSSTIIASVTRDSDGNTPAGNVFPAGVPVAFATNLGAVSPASAFTASPMASTTFTSSSPGVANVTATMDSATVGTTVTVNPNATAPAAASETSPALPTVSFASPNENGTLGLGDQTPVSLNVSAPAGVGSVGLSFNGRSVCTLTVAPFICQFRPSATDAGRAGTFTAIVTDAQGRAASASRVVVVGGPATLGSHTGLVSNGVARIRIKCAQFGPCRGTLALRSRLGGRHSPLVGIGSTSFNLRSGATRTIRLEISSGALQRLRQKAFLGTRTTVTTGDVALTRNLVLHLK